MVEANATLTEEQLQQHVLTQLKDSEAIADSADLVEQLKVTAAKMDAALKSLLVDEYIVLEVIERR